MENASLALVSGSATEKVAKAVNYTAEQTAMLVEAYTTEPSRVTVEKMAETLGKSVKSIVAKLSREKVYIKPEYKTKSGGTVIKKDSLIDKLSELVEFTENEASSFDHVNKTALVKLLAALS